MQHHPQRTFCSRSNAARHLEAKQQAQGSCAAAAESRAGPKVRPFVLRSSTQVQISSLPACRRPGQQAAAALRRRVGWRQICLAGSAWELLHSAGLPGLYT